MGRPARLNKRPVQGDAPRVQCCFETARALGLLRVTRTMHRAEATEEIDRYRKMDETGRLWAVLEALWNRVSWALLRHGANGDAEWQQAGRYWLGAELARRTVPVEFGQPPTGEAEILETFLLPFWRDAGLVTLDHDPRMPVYPHLAKRTTKLRRFEPTGGGRRIFELLSEASPGREHLEATADEQDGRWPGRQLVRELRGAGERALFGGESPFLEEAWSEEE
jgi:hypothetical protein